MHLCPFCTAVHVFFAANYKRRAQFEVHKPHVVLFIFLKCFSHTGLCIHKPDGLIYEVIKTVNVKPAEAAATER